MPHYLFVNLDEAGSQSWVPIRSTVGVSQIVRFGHYFAYVSNDVVSWVKEHASTIKIDELFKEGSLVRVIHVPFRSMEAIFKTYDGGKIVILPLKLLAKIIKGGSA